MKLELLHKFQAIWYPILWLFLAFFIIWVDNELGTAPFHRGYHYFIMASAMGGYVSYLAQRKSLKTQINLYKKEKEEIKATKERMVRELEIMKELNEAAQKFAAKQMEIVDGNRNKST